ncbi:hypothetical protein ABFA07_000359 [Porites harrisoni]
MKSMKITACLLFYQFLVEIDSFSPLSDLTAVKLAELKKDGKIANLFDDDGGSGSGSGEKEDDKIEKAIKSVVGALRTSVVPALVKATKEKEEENEESVKKLFQMLKAGVKRKGVKREFGKSLLESHGKCRKVIFQFFTEAKEEGLVDRLKESMETDYLDFGQIVETIVKEAWKNDEGILEKIEDAVEGSKKLHPAMKAVVIMKKLLLNAACGNPAEELVKEGVGLMLSDPEKPFEVLMKKILPFLLKPRECRKGLIEKGYQTINKRVTNLLLKAPYPCQDVPIVRRNVQAALAGQAVMKNISVLHSVYGKRIGVTVGKVIKLMQHGYKDDAFELLGEQEFGFLREAFLIGLAINKRDQGIIQHNAPSPAELLKYLEKESNLRRSK